MITCEQTHLTKLISRSREAASEWRKGVCFSALWYSCWWHRSAMSLYVKVNLIRFQRHPISGEQWKGENPTCKTEQSNSKKKQLKFLNVNPINFTQQLLHTNPDFSVFFMLAKVQNKCVCLKKKGKDNEGKFRWRALLISYSATGYMSGLIILLQQGEHNAALQRCSKYPPTLLISRVCTSEDRLWSLDWVSTLLSAPFPSLTVEFFI